MFQAKENTTHIYLLRVSPPSASIFAPTVSHSHPKTHFQEREKHLTCIKGTIRENQHDSSSLVYLHAFVAFFWAAMKRIIFAPGYPCEIQTISAEEEDHNEYQDLGTPHCNVGMP